MVCNFISTLVLALFFTSCSNPQTLEGNTSTELSSVNFSSSQKALNSSSDRDPLSSSLNLSSSALSLSSMSERSSSSAMASSILMSSAQGVLSSSSLSEQSQCIEWNVNSQNLVAQGYDVIGYFKGSAQKGSPGFKSTFQGAEFQFSSLENQMIFEENPEMYLPQYGGYCAYAMSKGAKATVNPLAFEVLNGKLYLQFSLAVLDLWQVEKELNVRKADQYWPELCLKE